MREMTEVERKVALSNAISIIRRNLPEYTYECQDANSIDGLYKPINNIEWTKCLWLDNI